jgi:hypothetical protein
MKPSVSMSALCLFLTAGTAEAFDEVRKIEVFKTQTCACCVAWIARLEKAGFSVEAQDMQAADLIVMKQELGMPANLVSCHTGLVEGYVIEGHVPPEDIKRLLVSGEQAIGLAVAGMPVGSPGMEYGSRRDAFDVELVREDGSTAIFASYDERR